MSTFAVSCAGARCYVRGLHTVFLRRKVANLIVARPGCGQRSTLYNRRFAIRNIDGQVTRRVLSGFQDYSEVLVQHFGLSLDEDEVAAIATAMESHAADEEVLCFFQ